MLDNRPLDKIENVIGKVAYDEDRFQRLPHCGKNDYAGLMTEWENIGIYNQRIWVAVAKKVIDTFLIKLNGEF